MGVLNAPARFRKAARKTGLYSKHPKRIREVFNIREAAEDGIFKIQQKKYSAIYDRCYIFADVNYINKDWEQKNRILQNMMQWLNSMTVHFKITLANEYRDMHSYIRNLTRDRHKKEHETISRGIDEWIEEKLKAGKVRDLNRVMYLTITKEAATPEAVKDYFQQMDKMLEKLFRSMQSDIRPLSGKERLETMRSFFHPKETDYPVKYDFRNRLKDPMNTVLPAYLEQEKRWLMLGERYASVLFARDYSPQMQEEEVLHALSSLPYISMLTMDYAPIDRQLLREMLQALYVNNEKAIAQEMDARRKRGQYGMGIPFEKESKREELEEYMLQWGNNNESAFHLCMLFVITADSEEELKSRIEEAVSVGKEAGVFLETCNHTQLKSLNTVLPNGCRNISYPRCFLTSSVVGFQPFHAQELQDPGGVFLGLNSVTKQLVFGNRKLLSSPHAIIIGYTGSGKSVVIKIVETSQVLLGTDDDVIILDPQNEFTGICRAFNGQFIDLTPKAKIYINPMEISKDMLRAAPVMQNAFVAEQCGWIRSFCKAAMRNIILTEEHYAILSRAVREIYEEIFAQGKLKDQPTLKDVRERIKTYMEQASSEEDRSIARRLYNSLEEYAEGAFDLFAHPSNIDITKRLVVFGLANVPQDLWEPAMITIMHFLSNRMEFNRKQGRPTRLIVDETQEVCRNPSSAAMLLRAVRTFRKFGGMVTMAMQNLTGVLENDKLRDMFSNCGYKLFLNQSGVDANELKGIQELSEEEFKYLKDARPGHGLLVWGQKVIPLDCVISPENPLYDMVSTNFHEQSVKADVHPLQEKGGSKENAGKRSPEEMDEAVLRLTQVVPVSLEEMCGALDSEAGPVADAINRLLESEEIAQRTENGTTKYLRKE